MAVAEIEELLLPSLKLIGTKTPFGQIVGPLKTQFNITPAEASHLEHRVELAVLHLVLEKFVEFPGHVFYPITEIEKWTLPPRVYSITKTGTALLRQNPSSLGFKDIHPKRDVVP